VRRFGKTKPFSGAAPHAGEGWIVKEPLASGQMRWRYPAAAWLFPFGRRGCDRDVPDFFIAEAMVAVGGFPA